MGVSLPASNKIFLVLGLVFQLWFIILYAIDYEYIFFPVGTTAQQASYSFLSVQGFILVVFLLLLFFLGLTIVNTYVAGSAYSSALFSFMIVVFTIQYYFIIRSFWIGTGLANDSYTGTLAQGKFKMIRILSTDVRFNSSFNTNVGFTESIVCALSMLVAYMALAGRIGSLQVFILCFFGVFFYSFNETVIWRHQIADNGYTMRLFIFGSTFGLLTAFVLRFKDNISTTQSEGYFASRHTRTYGLIGAAFTWLFLPILSGVNQIYDINNDQSQTTYLAPAMLNNWFALSASATSSYCVSILLGRKIHPHDIVFSAFTGGIAYGATSTLNPDPFPAILIGLIVGILITILNHKLKKSLNNPEVIDTQGVIFTFFTAGLLGGIYSACLAAVGLYGPTIATSVSTTTNVAALAWSPIGRDRYSQGGFQIAGTFIALGIGALSAVAVAILTYLTAEFNSNEVFNDTTFAQINDAPIQPRLEQQRAQNERREQQRIQRQRAQRA